MAASGFESADFFFSPLFSDEDDAADEEEVEELEDPSAEDDFSEEDFSPEEELSPADEDFAAAAVSRWRLRVP